VKQRVKNLECHLHIPQLKKGIHVLNIIIQGLLKKKRCEKKDPKGTPKTLMPPIRVWKPNESKNFKGNPKGELAHLKGLTTMPTIGYSTLSYFCLL
jgi:hypothetical protein